MYIAPVPTKLQLDLILQPRSGYIAVDPVPLQSNGQPGMSVVRKLTHISMPFTEGASLISSVVASRTSWIQRR